jgi:phosphatidylglycerol lysyltransferase
MLACSPIYARRGWYLEDLIRRPGAERGVSELLVVEAIGHLADEGAELATLATSQLAGIKPDALTTPFKQLARMLTFIYENLDAFYHFKTLHRFKSKFAPSFIEPEYVAIYPPRIRLRMIYAVIGAFDPAGFTGLIASKLGRIWHEALRSGKTE